MGKGLSHAAVFFLQSIEKIRCFTCAYMVWLSCHTIKYVEHKDAVFISVKTHPPFGILVFVNWLRGSKWGYAFFVRSFGWALFVFGGRKTNEKARRITTGARHVPDTLRLQQLWNQWKPNFKWCTRVFSHSWRSTIKLWQYRNNKKEHRRWCWQHLLHFECIERWLWSDRSMPFSI